MSQQLSREDVKVAATWEMSDRDPHLNSREEETGLKTEQAMGT